MADCLLDVNVLLALAWTNREHHAASRQWFAARQPQSWATCPITQCGFVRLSSNPRVIGAAISPSQAAAKLRAMTTHHGHTFGKDEIPILDPLLEFKHIQGHRQVMDAYLVAHAAKHAGHFATFDQGVPWLAVAVKASAPILVIPT